MLHYLTCFTFCHFYVIYNHFNYFILKSFFSVVNIFRFTSCFLIVIQMCFTCAPVMSLILTFVLALVCNQYSLSALVSGGSVCGPGLVLCCLWFQLLLPVLATCFSSDVVVCSGFVLYLLPLLFFFYIYI